MENKQGVCPLCGSGNVEGKTLFVDRGRLYLLNVCNDCGGQFADVFKVDFVESLKISLVS